MFCHEESHLLALFFCVLVSYNNIKSKPTFVVNLNKGEDQRWDAIMLDVLTKTIFEIDRHFICDDVCICESI